MGALRWHQHNETFAFSRKCIVDTSDGVIVGLGKPARLYVEIVNMKIDSETVPEFIRHLKFRSSIVFDSHKYVFIFFTVSKAFQLSREFRFGCDSKVKFFFEIFGNFQHSVSPVVCTYRRKP